ncbi:Fic family protein [Candidatus Saccharibacteria bacterium]|nr:Fic family protein [Candidatus Saccharibacteria bacterium]
MEKYDIKPDFNSELTSTLFQMESLRNKFISGDTPLWLFYDLKDTLHLLESLNSARIEGNHTTLIEAINEATKTDTKNKPGEELAELTNIQNAINYIEENLQEEDKITSAFIRELHAITVRGLTRDCSHKPGAFRTDEVAIANSSCVVSTPQAIPGDIAELVDYINADHEKKEDVIRIACAHHRFVQIHPFDNGNGRTARLLTYAMLIKYGFLKRKKTLLNPSSIFCMDRQKYYDMLAKADAGSREGIEEWCDYVANGILGEINKMFRLLDRDFAVKNLIIPAIKESRKDEHLSEKEYQILMIATEKDIIQASDVASIFGATPSEKVKCSRFLASMVEKGLLLRPPKAPKKYVARFFNKSLLPYVMAAMGKNGLIDTK